MGTTKELAGRRTCPICEAMCGLDVYRLRADDTDTNGNNNRDRIGKVGGRTGTGGNGTRDADGRSGPTRRWLIRGDADHPLSEGFLCPKGSVLGSIHDDPDRLTKPMVRVGRDRTNGDFRAVSWSEAFDLIGRRLGSIRAEHGTDAVGVYAGNPNAHSHENILFVSQLIRALKTKQFFSASTADQMPKHVSCGLMFGDPNLIPVPDINRGQFLVIIGGNPAVSNGSLWGVPDYPARAKALLDRGGEIVVVDPIRTATAEAASRHLAPVPGTDAHLLLAMINVIVNEGLAAPDRLADITTGLDDLPAVVAGCTPEWAAEKTGLATRTIADLARQLAAASQAAVYTRIGAHTTVDGTVASWATDVLNLITGNLDRPGGAMFGMPGHGTAGSGKGRGFTTGRWSSRVDRHPEVKGEFPVASMADEILTEGDGRIRAMVVVAGNPLLSAPDSARLAEAFQRLEFVISVDPWLNETSRTADVILPPPGPLSRSHYDLGLATHAVRNFAHWSPPIEPAGDIMAEWEILTRLSMAAADRDPNGDVEPEVEAMIDSRLSRAAVGLDRPVEELRALLDEPAESARPPRSPADKLVDIMLRTGHWGDGFGLRPDGLSLNRLIDNPSGIDLGPLFPRLPAALKTRDGMIDLVPSIIAKRVSTMTPPPAAEDTAGEDSATDAATDYTTGELYPYRLIGRRHLRSNNTWLHNVPALVKGKHRCTLLVHPDDASELTLTTGDAALVRSEVGELVALVEVTDRIRPGVVSLPHGWGHDAPGTRLSVAAERPGVNSNLLTVAAPIDPLSGNAQLNNIPVSVAAVDA